MRSASARAGSPCARACYVRVRACVCARSSHACANEISMRVGSRDCLKGLRKKRRGEIKPRLNGFDHPIQSITFCSRHHTDKFTVFFLLFFRSIFFLSFLLLSLLSACFNGRKWKREVFYCPRSLYENKAWISSLFPCFGNMSSAGQKVRRLLYTLARFPRVFHPIQLID